ncbi:hypothetical protein DYB28_006980 [Aphanomyces astaci]|uniref:Arrestin C-terminal-like domain-containing protein n=1 Tax=Aphanomyces astaci TaxID=112090 RepID=A0A397BL67_APHAT|nr:hypothetical protein DYB36_003564 [Aphanomyces astaci]RHY63062.1 hypothetical protein DYB34_004200 [Aphanomyces astaci]RLO05421.1 hypothetical protein DYB28_006980 [Aphanomyces astaci]
MGFLGGLLHGKGAIRVNVDKPYYISGEVITGNLAVDVLEPIECNGTHTCHYICRLDTTLVTIGVVLVVTGKEKVYWSENHTETNANGESRSVTRVFADRREFFKQKIVLFNVQHSLAPGSYIYPFQYQLPPGLPGCFDNQSDKGVKAKIEYSIKGSVDVAGLFSKDLKSRQKLTVYAQLAGVVAPSADQKVQTVRLFCCISQGTCSLRAIMDKNMYGPGETPQIHVDVQNQSSRDVNVMRCELRRHVQAHASGKTRNMTKVICHAAFAGVPAGGAVSQPQPFQLTGTSMYPSTRSALLSCHYTIDIVCDIALCPDVELHLPIALGAPTLVPVLTTPPFGTYSQQPTVNQPPYQGAHASSDV